MLSRKEYILQSLEHNLFFLRIMKEHIIFAVSALTLRDYNMIQPALLAKSQFESLLREAIPLANGVITSGAVASGDIITPFTLNAEILTQNYTAIPIDMDITRLEAGLRGSNDFAVTPELEQQVSTMNQRIIPLVDMLIQLKTTIYNNVTSCRMFTHLYPLLLEHVRHEAEFYRQLLQKLQNRQSIDMMDDMAGHEVFWNEILGEHAQFIRGMLDPTEKMLIKKANDFAGLFDRLTAEARLAASQMALLPQVTRDSFTATGEIRNFKAQGTQGILSCQIKSVILPLLADHVLREASHYYRMLAMMGQSK